MYGAQFRRVALLATVVAAWLAGDRAAAQKDSFQFVVLGDRTGDARAQTDRPAEVPDLPGAFLRLPA